jgi:SAM-dependent methyltransferase
MLRSLWGRVCAPSGACALLLYCFALPACSSSSGDDPVRIHQSLKLPKTAAVENRGSGVVYKKDYTFTEDWFSANIPAWERALAPNQGKPKLRYLEIGVFEGRALFWMLDQVLTAPDSSAVTIDPFDGNYKDRYQANLIKSGAAERVETIIGYSQIELRKQPLESFDVIYIDGSHTAADVLEDAILCTRLLKPGGIMIFDDYQWKGWEKPEPPANTPGPAIDIFYALYGKQFAVLHNGYQVILRKI